MSMAESVERCSKHSGSQGVSHTTGRRPRSPEGAASEVESVLMTPPLLSGAGKGTDACKSVFVQPLHKYPLCTDCVWWRKPCFVMILKLLLVVGSVWGPALTV
ncbi:hypothetical protein GN956_G11106 [Arapaima gigas]